MTHRLEIKTADGWVVIPNATVSMELSQPVESDYADYTFSATTGSYTFTVDHADPGLYDLITGRSTPSDEPIYDSLVDERIEYWKGMK